MTTPTERQVLYALVGAAVQLVVAVLVVGAAVSGIAPLWWTIAMAVTWTVVTLVAGATWRRTGRLLALTVGLFVVWTIGTLVVR